MGLDFGVHDLPTLGLFCILNRKIRTHKLDCTRHGQVRYRADKLSSVLRPTRPVAIPTQQLITHKREIRVDGSHRFSKRHIGAQILKNIHFLIFPAPDSDTIFIGIIVLINLIWWKWIQPWWEILQVYKLDRTHKRLLLISPWTPKLGTCHNNYVLRITRNRLSQVLDSAR